MKTKRILCFGDSNTWGYNPLDGSRYSKNIRWPGAMESALGNGFIIIEDGFNGRTASDISTGDSQTNGVRWINESVHRYIPLDVAIISLGLNDVFDNRGISLRFIADGISKIIQILRSAQKSSGYNSLKIVLMTPVTVNTSFEGVEFYELELNKASALPGLYTDISIKEKCLYFDTSRFIKGSSTDGTHLEAEMHLLLGNRLAEFIRNNI